MNQVFKFDCIFYYVSDLDRSIDFYTKVLGLSLASRDAVARFHIDSVLFELVPTDDASVFSGKGNARLTLAVDDINAARSKLLTERVAVSEVRTVANGLLASFTDPDGNEIILWQYS